MIAMSSHQYLRSKSERSQEHMGRWAMMTITLPSTVMTGSGKLHILSIYRATAEKSGDNSTLSQQARSLTRANRNITPSKLLRKT